jgi:hypothetical protein
MKLLFLSNSIKIRRNTANSHLKSEFRKVSKDRLLLGNTESPHHLRVVYEAYVSCSSDQIVDVSRIVKKILLRNTKVYVKSGETSIYLAKDIFDHLAV